MKRLFAVKRLFIIAVVLVVAGGGFGLWYMHGLSRQGPAFRTATAQHGTLTATISATGTLEPEEVVDVGAQVAGMIKAFGQDPRDSTKSVDYGTLVEPGTVLARIDDAVYKSQVAQAKANLQRAEADLLQYQAKVKQSQRDWERAQSLSHSSGAISGLDYDTALATYESAKSALAVGQAAVAQAKASLEQVEINLGYCTIQSPVKGVIVDRRVNTGQTVVASLNAPSLFLIAKDLAKMQIWASVNEADIGQIQPGQDVRFTVDAHPDQVFKGVVAQIRLNATMTQNVVTYTVVVNIDNADSKLPPYLTANLQFQVGQKKDVLLIPNSALRWKPQVNQVVPDQRAAYGQAQRAKEATPGDKPTAELEHSHQGTLWVPEGNLVRPVAVHTGLTDGQFTEITGSDLPDRSKVVIGMAEAKDKDSSSSASPFTPQMFGKKAG